MLLTISSPFFQEISFDPPTISNSGRPIKYEPATDKPLIEYSAPSSHDVKIGRKRKVAKKTRAESSAPSTNTVAIRKKIGSKIGTSSSSTATASKGKLGPNVKKNSSYNPSGQNIGIDNSSQDIGTNNQRNCADCDNRGIQIGICAGNFIGCGS